MGTKVLCSSIDEDIFNEFQEQVGKRNVSKEISRFMEQFINYKNRDLHKFNLEKVNEKIIKLEERINNLKKELKDQQKLKHDIQIAIENKKRKDLEDKEKKIKRLKTCAVCGIELTEEALSRGGYYNMKDKTICKGCYTSMRPIDLRKMIDKWEGEEGGEETNAG